MQKIPRAVLHLLFTLAIVLAVAWVVWEGATVWGRRSGLFPLVVGVPILLLAIGQLVVEARGLRSTAVREVEPHADDQVPRELVAQRTAGIIATILGFVVAVWLFGFIVAVPLVTFLYLKIVAQERWPISVWLSTAAGVSFYAIFVLGLGVPAPFGVLLGPLLEQLE